MSAVTLGRRRDRRASPREDIASLCIAVGSSIRDVVASIDRTKRGIALVVDAERRLVGTVTDGDVRRAMLNRIDLERPVEVLLARKAGTPFAKPIAAPVDANRETCLNLLQRYRILHLPLLDREKRVVGLVTLNEFIPDRLLPLKAVVMAGGPGRRLHPLTSETPKPMLEVGGRPLLEIIIQRLREAGIQQVTVTTHHNPEKIAQHFGDGKEFGVRLSYVSEDRPLGTAGGLGLFQTPQETTLVINGDILTQVDFRSMLAYHREHQADLTMAVRHYDFRVPYGVVECDGPLVQRLQEKPTIELFVNAGIYLLEPVVYRFIPNGRRFDMTDLIQRLLAQKRPVISFPVREYWLDIGDLTSYQKARHDAARARRKDPAWR